jgi:hypothetical protein
MKNHEKKSGIFLISPIATFSENMTSGLTHKFITYLNLVMRKSF